MAKPFYRKAYKGQTLGWMWWKGHSRYSHRQVRRETRADLRTVDPEEFTDRNPRRRNAKWEGWMD